MIDESIMLYTFYTKLNEIATVLTIFYRIFIRISLKNYIFLHKGKILDIKNKKSASTIMIEADFLIPVFGFFSAEINK